MMKLPVRIAVVVTMPVVALAAAAQPAGAAHKVGPGQYFTGVINGRNGNTTIPITIRMACFGPIIPGQTGHPMKGQTLAIHQLFPPTTTGGSLGYTGTDAEVGVFFNAPPPAAPRVRAAATTPIFHRYNRPQPLSTALTLPCGGTGTVWFTPIPVIPPSRSQSVSVQYVGQP